ncbi:hypothetical protein D3227_35115 [Mesorhizobium waimense]|uniref:MarR family transcriptional regulator n=1 Tax=Mesorhizobium waimense TaxID=1300307 RepID=A0A3A5JZ90_9HYPH|nr:hypothetical protein [Mesorhizobium waimense]RJT28128.1 hypothetical protein D3227_35115 [Mesorhizobium waimense]
MTAPDPATDCRPPFEPSPELVDQAERFLLACRSIPGRPADKLARRFRLTTGDARRLWRLITDGQR